MNYLFTPLLFLLPILCAPACARAQVRKAALPLDTGVLNVAQPIVPYDIPSKPSSPSSEKYFGPVEQQPQFPGGTKALYKFIEANLRIPSMAREIGISGKVFTTFTIEITGEITNVTVLRGLGFGCDEEAIRLVESMPNWKPGTQSGKIVKVKYNLPISFMTK
ncbi:energy transducer TonB [Dyadobacter jiangsuensis]|uniref:TonB family protein n=1 Tax=Dyadobacter jiangsuensis TaxID=1591085 RepID=A0A2P8GJC5_9BACT|nr:energy transducer TonB [Dyadobacter jiangsuensis]PSL34040.1 TonB family protein [Dyadobacter jiangsuensis]